MKKSILILVSVVALVLLIGVRLYSNKQTLNEKNKVVDRSGIPVPVTTVKVGKQDVSGKFSLPAVLEPVYSANVSINAAGKIQYLHLELGTVVQKGQVLGSVDNSLKQLNLKAAQLLADKNEADYLRIKDLYDGKAATEVDLINARYNMENAKVQVAQIRQQIADGLVIAPISGVVTKKNVEAGEFVNMGSPIATVVDVSSLKSYVQVNEKNIYRLSKGKPVAVRTDIYPGKIFKGKILYISPNGDESHSYEVGISIENDKQAPLKGGTFIRVDFDASEGDHVLQIPKMALVEGVKNPYVYAVEGTRPAVRKVVLGRDLGEKIEVVSGLEEGDEIVTSGQINISDKSILEVVK
jgi:membrane fusion protein (multidrug efflux system)